MTGSMPGMAASTKLTLALGGLPNSVEEPENSLDCEVTCACTSMPMTTSQSPVAPGMKYFGVGVRVSTMLMKEKGSGNRANEATPLGAESVFEHVAKTGPLRQSGCN